MTRDRDVDPKTGGQRRYLRPMGEHLWLTWGDDSDHDDEVIEIREFLGANGYVVVPRPEFEALLAAANGSVEAFHSRRMNTAAETLSSAVAAVVEAVDHTKET